MMKASRCIIVFVLLLLHYSNANGYDSCDHHMCNDNGFCINNKECRCELGFYGSVCDKAVEETIPKSVDAFQVVLCVGFLAAAVLSFLGLVLAIKKIKDTSGPTSRIRTAVFGIVFFISILNFLLDAIDPLAQEGTIPDYLFKVLLSIDEPLCLITFYGVLLHWMELVQLSRQKLNHENMLKQINANYPGKTITLEDIVESVKFLRKFRVPFFVLAAFTLVFGIVTELFVEVHIYPLIFNTLQQAFFLLMWIAVTIGFFLIRKKLVDLMPYQVSSNVRKLTIRVASLSVTNLMVFILFCLFEMASTPHTAGGTLALWVIERSIVILSCILTCSVFLHLRRGFPFVSVTGSTSADSHTGATGTDKYSTNTTTELSTIVLEKTTTP